MLSLDRCRKRKESVRATDSIPLPLQEFVPQYAPVEQVAFPDYNVQQLLPISSMTRSETVFNPCEPLSLADPLQNPSITYLPASEQTETLLPLQKHTTLLRDPVLIPGSGKKSLGLVIPPRGRRIVVHGAVSFLSIFILLGSLMAVLPVDSDGHAKDLDFLQALLRMVPVKRSNTSLIIAQAATATAVTQDGYDPGGGHQFAGVQSAPANAHIPASDAGNLSRFFYGQCTYWANMRYHQLTGHWIPWLGNAYQWAYQAPAYGWAISSTPNPNGPSIIVLAPYAQGSGAYGHVAIVEKINSDGSVVTSNWNWEGNWATQDWVTFYPGRGVSFVWYPG